MTIIQRPRAILRGLIPVLVLFGLAAEAHAQATFRGRVATDRGEPIAGATVSINELALSVLTNAQGQYTLIVPAARVTGQAVTISARAIGFRSQARAVASLTAGEFPADFQLAQDINRLEEVVVTGVMEGVERAKVPFAVGRVTAEDLPVPAMDPMRALQGKVSGVRIASTSGFPGSTPEIMLRGPTSINAQGRGQGPLIIVDGAAMNVGSLQELGGLDIESIEVVKGAAGAALYGTRAANGVITIRTKRGLQGGEGVRFTARAEYGFSQFNVDWGGAINHHLQLDETGKRFCVLQSGFVPCSRTFDWMTEIYRINNVNADTTRTPQATVFNSGGTTFDLRNNYQAQIWPNQYYDMAASVLARNSTALTSVDALGRIGSVSFYASAQYQDEGGAVKGLDGVRHVRGRVNLDYDLRRDLRISLSSMYDRSVTDLRSGGSTGSGAWSIFGQITRGAIPATDYRARDTLGRPIVRGGGAGLRGTGNGAGAFLYDQGDPGRPNRFASRWTSRFLGGINARYFPTDWFTLEGSFSLDNRDRQDLFWQRKGFRTISISTAMNNGNVDVDNLFQQSYSASLAATVRRQLSEDLNAKFSVSAGYVENSNQTNASGGIVLRVADVYTTGNTSTNFYTSSSSNTTKELGLYAAANFDYKDRYILEGSYRYDGSSRFGAGNRWAPFNRISGVWRISEEPFWNLGFLDDARFRLSRGTAGSTPNFNAQYEVYTVTATGISLGQAGNSQLKPETTTEWEAGVDFTLFGRIGMEVTYAHGLTRDQILPVNTPASLGFTTQWQNAGTIENKTWELGATIPVINSRNLYWQMRGTWDRTRTYIKELFVPEFTTTGGTAQGSASFFRIREGERYGTIYGARFLTSCSQLPATVAADCGTSTSSYQFNDTGWLVWVGAGNSWRDGITKNLWTTVLPAAQSPFGVPLSFGHPIIEWYPVGHRNQGQRVTDNVLGNTFPAFRWTFTNDIQYKNLTLYTLVDATVGHRIYNQNKGWGILDFSSREFDQAGKTVETAKPVGYSWRCGPPCNAAGTGGFYDALGVNNWSAESGTYAKFREVSLTYRLGPVAGTGDWTLGVIGRNIFTITNYTGFDPEVGVAGGVSGSGLINQIDAFGFPQLRTFTFSVSTRF
jgi:TonB-linked SusC/RagA family outer membrane protein